jgi:phage terminase small subunit
MDERSKRTLVDQDFVVQGFLEVYRRCIQATPVMVWDYDEKGMVQAKNENGEGVYEFDSQGANTALSNLAKHLAMFNDKAKVKIEDETGKTITVEYVNA